MANERAFIGIIAMFILAGFSLIIYANMPSFLGNYGIFIAILPIIFGAFAIMLAMKI